MKKNKNPEEEKENKKDKFFYEKIFRKKSMKKLKRLKNKLRKLKKGKFA